MNSDLLHIFANPQRDRSTPIPISRDIPISRVGDPISKSSIADILRDPIAFF